MTTTVERCWLYTDLCGAMENFAGLYYGGLALQRQEMGEPLDENQQADLDGMVSTLAEYAADEGPGWCLWTLREPDGSPPFEAVDVARARALQATGQAVAYARSLISRVIEPERQYAPVDALAAAIGADQDALAGLIFRERACRCDADAEVT